MKKKTFAKNNADVTDKEVVTPYCPCMLAGRLLGRHCRVPTWILRTELNGKWHLGLGGGTIPPPKRGKIRKKNTVKIKMKMQSI